MSFLEVQDGMLETVGKIIDRMSELKGLSSQDPMKSEQDKASYNNEFKDLQVQLYDIGRQKFNGVSLFANYRTDAITGNVRLGQMALRSLTLKIRIDHLITLWKFTRVLKAVKDQV